jgi:hypothetical protein
MLVCAYLNLVYLYTYLNYIHVHICARTLAHTHILPCTKSTIYLGKHDSNTIGAPVSAPSGLLSTCLWRLHCLWSKHWNRYLKVESQTSGSCREHQSPQSSEQCTKLPYMVKQLYGSVNDRETTHTIQHNTQKPLWNSRVSMPSMRSKPGIVM